MIINLLRAASLCGKDYVKGIHEVSEEIKKDAMYPLLVADKMIQEVVDAKAIADEYTIELEKENDKLKEALKGAIEKIKSVESSEKENIELRNILGQNVKTIDNLNKQITKLKK